MTGEEKTRNAKAYHMGEKYVQTSSRKGKEPTDIFLFLRFAFIIFTVGGLLSIAYANEHKCYTTPGVAYFDEHGKFIHLTPERTTCSDNPDFFMLNINNYYDKAKNCLTVEGLIYYVVGLPSAVAFEVIKFIYIVAFVLRESIASVMHSILTECVTAC